MHIQLIVYKYLTETMAINLKLDRVIIGTSVLINTPATTNVLFG